VGCGFCRDALEDVVMGGLISASEALERLRFSSPKKGVVHRAELVVMLDKQRDTGPDVGLVKLADGSWTVLGSHHTPNGNWAVLGYGLDAFDKGVLKALVKAGAITAEDVQRHIEAAERGRAFRARKEAIKSLERACEDLGIPVPEVPQ
jgi:hypothetical protein